MEIEGNEEYFLIFFLNAETIKIRSLVIHSSH